MVSVIIPTYGRPSTLKRSIESVLCQTYQNIEIIVVDDNNPNTEFRKETEKVMLEFVSNDKVYYLQHEFNKNGSAARNTGIRFSHGEYITLLDDDDTMLPDKILKQMECIENHDTSYGLCYTGYKIFRGDGSVSLSTEKREGNCYLLALMRTFYICGGSNILFKKSIAEEINGFDESFKRNQDIEFIARILENYKIAYVDDILLEIHQEDAIRKEPTYETIETYTKHFLDKFSSRIDALSEKDRTRVVSVISLDRCRVAFKYKKVRTGFRILKDNKVKLIYILRYIRYLVIRVVTKRSFGFDGT